MLTQMRGRLFALILTLMLAFMTCAPAMAERMTVYVASDHAKVYDANGQEMGELAANTRLTLTGVKGTVCQVERDGKTAFMLKKDLAAQSAETTQPQTSDANTGIRAWVSQDGAKVYDAAGKSAGTLALNTEVTVTGMKGSVCRILCDGRTGYMYKSALSAEKVQAGVQCATAYVAGDGAKLYSADGAVLATLSVNTSVSVTAVKGNACKVSVGGETGYMRTADLSCEKIGTVTVDAATQANTGTANATATSRATGTAKEMDWWTSDIQTIFARGVVAKITDVETGLSWYEKRFGGTNHADCQPLTAADTAAMKKAYGGTWSWNRRAVFVTIDGVNYAASINGMPHGGGSINDNDFNGHHCIHFTNSRTHGSNSVCPLHQAAIKKAAAAVLK